MIIILKSYLEDVINGLDRRELICVGLDSDPWVEPMGEQVVNNLEPKSKICNYAMYHSNCC